MRAAKTHIGRAVNFSQTNVSMTWAFTQFLSGYKGWVSLSLIEGRFSATPSAHVRAELDKAVAEGVLLCDHRRSGVRFYQVAGKPLDPPKPKAPKCWYGGHEIGVTEFPNWTRQEIREYEERRGTPDEPKKCGGCNAVRKLQWVKRSLGRRGDGFWQWSLIFPHHRKVE